ncbi:MAG: hypothetical protein K6A43_11615 [Treponema sp.]|nr:hypothetical protein [Treponema sp.]
MNIAEIIAWNLAIDNNVAPLKLVGKEDTLDFNEATVDVIVDTYYRYNKKTVTSKGCKGQKGFLIFDWGGNGATNTSDEKIQRLCLFRYRKIIFKTTGYV